MAEPCPYPNQAGELVNSLSVNDPAIQIDAEIQTNKVIEEDRNELSQVSYQVVTGQADSAQSDLDTKEEEGSSPSENEIDSSAQLRLVAPAVEISSSNELSLDAVIASVYNAYPSLEAALHQRGIVNGELISAQGAFDTKFKAASENTTVGFYENYRNSIGLIQPLYQGGEVFAGYRIGRGSFEPWYKERQTNGGGEFKAGVVLPLAQDRTIDERRAEQWRTQYERHIVEAEIQAQLISFVQSASIAYWEWVAAGESYRVATQILELAESRSERIRSQVENGLLDPPELTDNLRLIAERQAKLAQTSEKLQKAAIKLSLYYRGVDGRPIIPSDVPLPKFPNPTMVNSDKLLVDSQVALNQRPELVVFELVKKQLDIDYTEACNQLRPEIDAVFAASKDTGEPTSSKNDKGPFQLDASLFVNVPLQRRKAKGKIHQIESKVSQLNAKRRLTEDNIVADVQSAYASLTTAFEQVKETQQAVTHAEELAQRERRNFELGSSDLLKVTLREQYAVESRQKNINARLSYFVAQANYRASLAQDALPR
ncbi:TolC family protein [Thalassoglobus polymorphus]|uniref:TolC family protein n=1 Tax=Thalassoglobus polymorphus TaxID=2527994 RepID=UPI0018D225E8|nr:TolC family protein [Thalassoglobus polymorphus]